MCSIFFNYYLLLTNFLSTRYFDLLKMSFIPNYDDNGFEDDFDESDDAEN